MGPALMQEMRDQAERFGTRFLTDQATAVELADEPGGVHKVFVGDDEYRARTVDPRHGRRAQEARGPRRGGALRPRRLLLRHLRRRVLQGQGDDRRRRRRQRDGGGDLPREVRREGQRRAPPRRVPRLEDHARARQGGRRTSSSRRRSSSRSFHPGRARRARPRASCATSRTAATEELPMDGAFIAIGHEPQSAIVNGQIDTDDEGYVIVQGRSTQTNRPGVFAAGDLVDHTYRQAVTAAGSGCQAALDAEWYLRDTPEVPTPEGLPAGDLAEAQWAPVGRAPSRARLRRLEPQLRHAAAGARRRAVARPGRPAGRGRRRRARRPARGRPAATSPSVRRRTRRGRTRTRLAPVAASSSRASRSRPLRRSSARSRSPRGARARTSGRCEQRRRRGGVAGDDEVRARQAAALDERDDAARPRRRPRSGVNRSVPRLRATRPRTWCTPSPSSTNVTRWPGAGSMR